MVWGTRGREEREKEPALASRSIWDSYMNNMQISGWACACYVTWQLDYSIVAFVVMGFIPIVCECIWSRDEAAPAANKYFTDRTWFQFFGFCIQFKTSIEIKKICDDL